ncbi:nucleolar protein 4-like [Uranotaenia lowii]|uniref:nucleolar protein 4-like n=1 Tax=Uranotaenia lowii TaxID=190385 RepID=UPI0024793B0E|nr:nucleolar protein 4-like [Uranotaenia lowii]
MVKIFQPWVIKTYGDRAKTKTITLKKQTRIIRALKGLEMNNPDSSKFRFWVKSKGFTTFQPKGFQDISVFQNQEENDGCLLFAPNTTETDTQPYKKVAVVENFFNIIYGVHVSLGSRSSRHAGQKRTYRTITETYAFLPREAVTKFLSLCGQCSRALRPQTPHLRLNESNQSCSPQSSKFNESFESHRKKEADTVPKTTTATIPVPSQGVTSSVSSTSNSNGSKSYPTSSSFNSLTNCDEIYSKLMDYCKTQGEERALGVASSADDNSTYYQLLKTFYDNVRRNANDDDADVKLPLSEQRRDVVEVGVGGSDTHSMTKTPGEEQSVVTVVDLTGTPDSDKASGRNSLRVPKSVTIEESCTPDRGQREESAGLGDDTEDSSSSSSSSSSSEDEDEEKVFPGAPPFLSTVEETAAAAAASENEKVRLNNNLEDDKFDDESEQEDGEAEVVSSSAGGMRLQKDPRNRMNRQQPASAASEDDARPITSTYLELTRSMGVTDDDALNMKG